MMSNARRRSSVHSHAPSWLKWMRNGAQMLDTTMEKLKDDSQTIERKIMDASKRLNQGIQGFAMGKYDLTQEEIVGILDILRIVVIPNIEGRMKTIKRIISEIKTSGVQEYKEYFDSPSRDLFFYENELEKRSIQLEASSKDIVILSRKLIEGKKNHADDTQRAKKLTTSLYHSASRSKLDSPSNKTKANAFDAEKYDKEWLVRVELCTSLPKMAGLVADDSCKAAVKRSMEDDEDEEGFGMSHSYNVFEMDLDVAKSSPSVKSERTMKVRMYHPDKIDKDKMKKSLLDIIVRMLDDDSWNVRRAAVKVFATFAHKGKKTTETLFPLCEDPKLQVCKTTFECIPRTISQKTSEYNETVLALLTILVSNMKDSRSKDLKDLIVEKRKAEISDFALTCILQVAKKDNALVINEFVRILETNHNPVMIISVLEVWPKLISPSDNLNAMRPVLNLLCSNEEVVRKQVATICPMLLSNPPSSDIVSFLVVFLSHENISVRKAAIADISGLNGEELKSRRAQLQKIAFGSKETIEVLSGEGRLISDGLNEEEERMLSRHGNDFVAKGLVCEMIKGTSGLESSHWKRRILLLNQYGEVWLASMNHLLDPIQIIARNSDIVVTKLQFGSLFQSALRIDVAAWLCDFIEIEKKNSRSNVRKRKDEHRRVDYNMTKYEENYYGKTEMALDQFITELMTPKLTSIGDRQSSDRMRILVERLNNLVTDKEVNADESVDLIAHAKKGIFSCSFDHLIIEQLFGTYFSPKQVSEAWKIANSGEGPSEDHDNLQMDWEEFQVCIKTLGKQAGIDVQSEEDERFKNLQKYQITEVKNLLLQHWNDFQLFARYCAGTQKGAAKNLVQAIGKKRMKSMDFKEFIELCEHIKLFPRVMSKAKLAKHFETANSFVELRDEDRHEFSFEEYKYVMIQIARELGVKIIVNGRDLTAKLFIAEITDKT
ncbi:hypothetical protein GUITHDRAFT_101347 [Guillardia theta CCMP2712]|uniref:Uncharacterized protein n=1 Tax=Guillardia theta (strain CCMP2712) TaxID=905079 RepID=L1JX21_GUITC|nr:hypothetical protein GUITHDRAFT_101347 [Guillardia theta CCMP2712]EKX52897.1 hypothetical protein GUITHDRAFT_101347 [Guillardia theta CCMP2712]|eukprot:XP_005839877.1 hypothetical protein GUITHDRAFT_101347 [Guillardia theta CCMP2712]